MPVFVAASSFVRLCIYIRIHKYTNETNDNSFVAGSPKMWGNLATTWTGRFVDSVLSLPSKDYYSFLHRISIPSAIGLLSLRLKGRLAGRGGTVCNRYKLEIL